MSHVLRNHKFWIILLCAVTAGIVSLYGWQQIQAQQYGGPAQPPGMQAPGVAGAPGVPGAPGAAVATPVTAVPVGEPTIGLSAVLPSGAKVNKTKNWDGMVTELLRFKYKTLDNRIITVHLPGVYRSEKMTRAGWDTCFQAFAMDVEAQAAARGQNREQMAQATSLLSQYLSTLGVEAGPSQGPGPVDSAIGVARSGLPSIGAQLAPLPPMLPGMY